MVEQTCEFRRGTHVFGVPLACLAQHGDAFLRATYDAEQLTEVQKRIGDGLGSNGLFKNTFRLSETLRKNENGGQVV